MKYPGEKWINITRRWTMVTWAFSPAEFSRRTLGVFRARMGRILGWDPVEMRL